MFARCAPWAGFLLAVHAAFACAGGGLFPLRKQELVGKDLPLEQLSTRQRDLAKLVIDRPAFSARGTPETFYCHPDQYQFFLDHPDRAVIGWRRLGAKCVSITPRGEQQFGWCDDQGSEVTWETIFRGPELQLWYAEGKVRPGPVMPLVPVKALLAMHHKEYKAKDGAIVVQQQAEVFVQTDSKTVTLMTKMLGPAVQKTGEQGMGQIQLFFSGISRYLEAHPDRTEALLRDED